MTYEDWTRAVVKTLRRTRAVQGVYEGAFGGDTASLYILLDPFTEKTAQRVVLLAARHVGPSPRAILASQYVPRKGRVLWVRR